MNLYDFDNESTIINLNNNRIYNLLSINNLDDDK